MEALGLDIKLMVIQVINFGVLFVVLNKFLYKPILKLLDQRKNEIEKSTKDSKKIDEYLQKIQEEKAEVIKEAKVNAEKERQELIKMTSDERKKILEEAQRLAQREIQKSLQKISSNEEESLRNIKKKFLNDVVDEMVKRLAESPKQKGKLLERILE